MSTHSALPVVTRDPSVMLGIACVIAGIFFLSLSDATVKWMGSAYNPIQILFLRATIALPVVATLALLLGGRRVLKTAHPSLHLIRGAINMLSAYLFYYSLRFLALAQASAIAFAAPLFVVALSVLVFKERVDRAGFDGAAEQQKHDAGA